jgi:hypothetical protein
MVCTLVGCSDQVSVTPPTGAASADLRRAELTVCVADDCKDALFGAHGSGTDIVFVAFEGSNSGETVTATLVMPDGTRYVEEGAIRTIAPNGRKCGPICNVGEIALDSPT